MSDILDPIPSPDGMPEEQEPHDLPIDVNEPASLPIDVFDEAPVKKADAPAKPAPSKPVSVQSDADKKKKTWIIVGVVALLLICCCVALILGGYFLFSDPSLQTPGGPGSLLPLFAM